MLINVAISVITLIVAVKGSTTNMPLKAVERPLKPPSESTKDVATPSAANTAVITLRSFGTKTSIRNRMQAPSDSDSAGSAAQIFKSVALLIYQLPELQQRSPVEIGEARNAKLPPPTAVPTYPSR